MRAEVLSLGVIPLIIPLSSIILLHTRIPQSSSLLPLVGVLQSRPNTGAEPARKLRRATICSDMLKYWQQCCQRSAVHHDNAVLE
eukprot:669575-Pelagomonas_calceolata.AAC.1